MKNFKFFKLKNSAVILLIVSFFNTNAQVANNSILVVGDNSFTFLSSGNYNFGIGGQTKTTRTNGNFGKIIFSPTATWSNANDNHFIDGYATTKSTSAFILPVGQSGLFAPVQVIPTTNDGVDAAYFLSNPNSVGTTLDAALSAITTLEYWHIKGAVADAKIALSWSNNRVLGLTFFNGTTISSLNNLCIAGFDGTKWVLIPSTVDATSFLGVTSTTTSGTISSNEIVDLTLFSAFTIGVRESECTATATWNGTSWNPFVPIATQKAVISGNYSEAVNLTACSLEIIGTAVVSVPSGFDFTITNEVNVASTASLTFENNANLLQTTDVVNIGNVNVKRTTSIQRLAYTKWSSPVANQNALTFSPLTIATRFYTYAEATNTFVELATPSITNLIPGVGYAIRAPNTFPASSTAEFIGTFTGIPNNGNYTFSGSKVADGYNLIGNPYPSTILVDAFLATNQNVNTLYFWDNSNLETAGNRYATRNSFTGTFSAVSTKTPTNFIAPGQGFYVQITSATNTNVVFNNAMRSSENTPVFFRNATSDKSLFKLNLLGATNTFNQIAIGYLENATNGIDNQIDAIPFAQSPTMVSSLINNIDYVIQGRALPFANSDIVPLGFKTDVAGNYSFTTEAFEGVFDNNQNVFVKDNLVGITHNVKQSPYQFSTNAGTFNSRFEIVYQSNLGIENPNFNDNSVFVFQKDGAIHINSGAIEMKNVTIFDLRGRKIAEKNNVDAITTEFNLNVAQQVLLVKITSIDGQIVNKKIIN